MNNTCNRIKRVGGNGRSIIRNHILIFFILTGIFTFLVRLPYVFAQVVEDLATAKEIQAWHEADIMALPGVIGIGIGSREEGGVEFVVLVDKDAPMPDLPSNLEGIPIVAEKISKIVIHNGGVGCDPCHNEILPMPVLMGTSTSTDQACFAGTTGFKACDPVSGKIGYVTNNHVGSASGPSLCENGPTGLIEVHPGTVDSIPFCALSGTMTIGTLSKMVPINFAGPNLVDAAFVESNDQETSSIIRDIGTPTTTPGTPTLNKCVKKSGRTTGLTFGRITCVNTTLLVGGYCRGNATYQDVFIFTPDDNCGLCEDPPCSSIAQSGDSGSPVLDLNNNVVGLYFAGNVVTGTFGAAATIQNVLSELNISLNLLDCDGVPPLPLDPEMGDANADGFVNLADLGVIINAFRGTPAPGNGDCNGDTFTNLADLGCVITDFRGGPTPTPTPPRPTPTPVPPSPIPTPVPTMPPQLNNCCNPMGGCTENIPQSDCRESIGGIPTNLPCVPNPCFSIFNSIFNDSSSN
ncbi:hypothetical protein MYX76_15865 [Desulfobacterota bacterium AH_259_B03_O07]|nr:hypothetical protein [Desulfobacterota bacterium AH_259_B03_O07]